MAGDGAGAGDDGVTLLGMWASPLSLRVEWALILKGIGYEYTDEDLENKSERLVKSNPIHKKIPVLLHRDRPIAESLVILEYIDEAWPESYPLLPEDPYARATHRFWAKYVDDKPWSALRGLFSSSGEEQLNALKVAQDAFKPLEELLQGKKFFGGYKIDYLDIAAGWMAIWVPLTEEVLGLTIVDPSTFPLLHGWFQEFCNAPVVRDRQPPAEKLLPFLRGFRERLISSSSS